MTNLICIVCPKGCHLSVDEDNDFAVTGNTCDRGIAYGQKELQNPTRVVTSTVKIKNAIHNRCPVKTDSDIPKGMIKEAMALLATVELTSPVKVGQVVSENIGGTGVNWVTTRAI